MNFSRLIKHVDRGIAEQECLKCLLGQIYSVSDIRALHDTWDTLPVCLQNLATDEIKGLVQKAETLSDKEVQYALNQMVVDKAIAVLRGYNNCPFPLPDIAQNKRHALPVVSKEGRFISLVSQKGRSVLAMLEKARQEQHYSRQIMKWAFKAGHPLFIDLSLYQTPKLSRAFIKHCGVVERPYGKLFGKKFIYPKLQLTEGCDNGCSHCCVEAKSDKKHMPYPLFISLYQQLYKVFQRYPQGKRAYRFSRFFDDSDMSHYYDSIIGADAGDVIEYMSMFSHSKQDVDFLTRGVTNNPITEKAFIKAFLNLSKKSLILLSFVDTPLDRRKSKEYLNRSLDVIEALKPFAEKCVQAYHIPIETWMRSHLAVLHECLKNGPTIDPELFRGYFVERTEIWDMGRAKNLKGTIHYPDERFSPDITIKPNGLVVLNLVEEGKIHRYVVGNVFDNKPPEKLEVISHPFSAAKQGKMPKPQKQR